MGKKKNRGKKKHAGSSSARKDSTSNNGNETPVTSNQPKRTKKGKRTQNSGGGQLTQSNDDYSFRASVELSGSRTIIDMLPDGNCLFRSISDQLYKDFGRRHDEIRNNICQFITKNKADFKGFLVYDDSDNADEDFNEYLEKMSEDGEWGGNPELVAAARHYQRSITIFSVDGAYTIECERAKVIGNTINLSYHGNDHYNSVRNESTTSIKKSSCMSTSTKNGTHSTKMKNIPPSVERNKKEEKSCGSGKNNMGQRRNDLCACGSGLRYKKCCRAKEQEKRGSTHVGDDVVCLLDGSDRNSIGNGVDDEFRILHI